MDELKSNGIFIVPGRETVEQAEDSRAFTDAYKSHHSFAMYGEATDIINQHSEACLRELGL